MFSTYVFNDCNDFENIIDDVTAILTGTVDVLQLSAGCDTVNTQILTTYDTSPWQLHDDGVSNSVVLKAPYSDSPSMKYLKISLVLSNGYCLLDMIGFESWNATTHVGVNSTYHDSTHDNHRLAFGKIDAARFNGVLYLYANDKTCAIQTQQSDGSIGTTYSQATGGLLAFSEFSRDLPWNVDYPSVGLISSGFLFNAYSPTYYKRAISLIRVKSYQNIEYEQCSLVGTVLNNSNTNNLQGIANGEFGKVPDNNGVFHIPLIHLLIGTVGYNNGSTGVTLYGYGIITGAFVNSGFYLVPINTLTDFELFTTDGVEYIAVRAFIDSSQTKRAMMVFKHG